MDEICWFASCTKRETSAEEIHASPAAALAKVREVSSGIETRESLWPRVRLGDWESEG